jgi:hypothetical protein
MLDDRVGKAHVVDHRGLMAGYRELRHQRKVAPWASLSPTRRAEWLRWRQDGSITAGVVAAGALLLLLTRVATSR